MKNTPLSPRRGAPGAPSQDPAETLAAIAPVARSSVVDAVATRLQNEILAGRIAAGSRLPSERELSLALGVNRLTLRAALARLEAQGLVIPRHGAGTMVASWRERAGLDALPTLIGSLVPWEPAWRELLDSMLELRRVLASEGLALAAARHTADDVERMRALAAEQPARVGDPIAFARGDVAFQRAVIHAARNVGLELLLNTFARLPEEFPELTAALYDRREDSLVFYSACIALVEAGDEAGARVAVRRALEVIDEDWSRRNAPAGARARRPAAGDAALTAEEEARPTGRDGKDPKKDSRDKKNKRTA
jgi:GntR family transcriptional regulator, transcriptional repressor for pyruvate dehydrogenase complex